MSLYMLPLAIGPWQIVLIVVIVLLLFGGKKIPELMRGLGSGIKEFKDASKEDEKLVRFIACGRLVKQKGFDRLIPLLAQFDTPYQWRLDIIGEGPERERLELLIQQLGLQNNVFLQGLILSPYDYFAGADCFLMPSRYEGLPNVVLEALACGTPVIATSESGGINEIANDCVNGAVKVVHDMTDFITEMTKIVPASKQDIAPSLVGECYQKETVSQFFEGLLRSYFTLGKNVT